jgi:hypothetical protein
MFGQLTLHKILGHILTFCFNSGEWFTYILLHVDVLFGSILAGTSLAVSQQSAVINLLCYYESLLSFDVFIVFVQPLSYKDSAL